MARNRSKPGNERGFSLLLTAIATVAMGGMVGVVLDMGRVYVAKNEVQSFADTAALASARLLDGTSIGVRAAHTAAATGPVAGRASNRMNFDTQAITGVSVGFGTKFAGPYDSYQAALARTTNSYRFVRVWATASVGLTLLRILPGIPAGERATAVAVAGQAPVADGVSDGGLLPFAVDAHDPSDTHAFGFTPGESYTLKWGDGNTSICAGDRNFKPEHAPAAHGYLDLGQGDTSSGVRQAIEYSAFPNANSNPASVRAGSMLAGLPADASVLAALARRSSQDPDQQSTTYIAYASAGAGNGRRIVTVAVDNPALTAASGPGWRVTVIGFANFLIDPGPMFAKSEGPVCAAYIGPASLSGPASAATDGAEVYQVRLYQ